MTFQIIDTTTKLPINLAEFDSKYCTLTGTPELINEFGLWFHWLEGVFNTYADIADKAKDSIMYEQVVHNHSNRMMTCDQVVKCLIIYEGKLVLPTDDFETLSYEFEQVKTLIKFFLSEGIRKEYYFEFHY